MKSKLVPPELRALWRQRAEVLATNVASGSREHREIAHAAALIRQDYHDRFLVELLQNANDQALVAGVHDSTVIIVRTARLLAVSNGGQAVTARNLERLSSLADSDKTGVLVGNKGVGFKAVYQVTDAPEIYSASADRVGSVFTDFGVGISLEQHPFEQQELITAVEDDVAAFFIDNTGLAKALADRGTEDPVAAVRSEFKRVAGFKFPLARDARDLAARLEDMGISEGECDAVRTLVVLPLRDQKASDDVKNAIDLLVGDEDEAGQAEQALLFLTGVARLVVIDRVRDSQWMFVRSTDDETPAAASITVTTPKDAERVSRFWTIRRDALSGDASVSACRRRVVQDALREFGLEAWKDDDPLPVTIALPMPIADQIGPLGPAGRFCLGLPTQQPTGLPVHVDARFFATISRTGLDFALPYNAMLLDVATELLGDLLGILRDSPRIEERRAVTLALHRTKGAIADRAFAPKGIADGDVVLAWGGTRFLPRTECRLPSDAERSLLGFVRDALAEVSEVGALPEEGLLVHAASVLESIDLPSMEASPHPWLVRVEETSVVEQAALHHRADGPSYWEEFANALLDCFDVAKLLEQSWLPVGKTELAAPSQRVFLPTSGDMLGDDDEVANVPPRVAAMIRLLDSSALRIREDGRVLTKLASRLDQEKLVRRPRKTELLEEALFPALSSAAEQDDDIAFELFAQAVVWIASMRDISRRKLDCSEAYVPIVDGRGDLVWSLASESYLGDGWGLPQEHERMLAAAYPGKRLVPFGQLRERFGLTEDTVTNWRTAVEVMGVDRHPRILSYSERQAPLVSHNGNLHVVGTPTLTGGTNQALDQIYQAYLQHLADTKETRWSQQFKHDVSDVLWIDDLEVAARREAIVDLVLGHNNHLVSRLTVNLGRVGGSDPSVVNAMWVFALSSLGWPVLPGEQGVGMKLVRVSAKELWRLPNGARRALYAQMLTVVPHAMADASRLLGAIGVPSVEDAPISRLLGALEELARRLDDERLNTRREAHSLAIELYTQVNSRLEKEPLKHVPSGLKLPLLRDRRIESVSPADAGVIVLFDDEPTRSRHIEGLERAYRVPVARDAAVDSLYDLFVRSWGVEHVLRSSSAAVRVAFSPSGLSESFLRWLQREHPHIEVAAHLATLLTFGSVRLVRTEPVSRQWKAYEKLALVFGTFDNQTVTAFYDRANDRMSVSASLDKFDVLAATWELAGARCRDLWAGYANALRAGTTHAFLLEREIREDVEVIDVADAAGLNRAMSVKALAPALLSARCHLAPGTTLDEAADWLSTIGDQPDDDASALGQDDIAAILTNALGQRSPEGEIQVVRHLGVPWSLWQDALARRDGERYVFRESAQRFQRVREHLIAVAREIGAREANLDLEALATALASIAATPTPDTVQFVPLDDARADDAALAIVLDAVAAFELLSRGFAELPALPWRLDDELPVPEKSATKRGVRLFRDSSASARESDATTTVNAVVRVAERVAASVGETVDAPAILGDAKLAARMRGEWSHVYSALLLLRPMIENAAPETTKKLSAAHAFRDPTTYARLVQSIPDLPLTERDVPQPKQSVLGQEFTAIELRADLAAGATGALGAKLAAAAARGIDPAILKASRRALPPPGTHDKGTGGRGGGSRASTWQARREPELVGDIGEAFVHECLGSVLGADYGPDCWVSKSRERYGLPAGNDGFGFDFKVPDPKGLIFGRAAAAVHIEVKATSTDGSGPFPMSRAEWEEARRCHIDGAAVYVIVRVFEADTAPRIGDVIFDPFAAYGRGEVRLADRDLWVTVAPLVISEKDNADSDDC